MAKTDVYKGILTYQYKKDDLPVFVELPVDRVKEIIELNKKGIKPDSLLGNVQSEEVGYEPDYENVVGQESLTRFDKKKKKKKHGNRNQNQNQPQNQNAQGSQPAPVQNQQKRAEAQNKPQQGNANGGGQNKNRHKHRNNNNRPNHQQQQGNGGTNA